MLQSLSCRHWRLGLHHVNASGPTQHVLVAVQRDCVPVDHALHT